MHAAPVIAVTDLDRARDFYEGRLELDGHATPGGWTVTASAGTVLYLLPGVDDAGSATWPVASFRVDDVHSEVRGLRERGVEFLGSDDLAFDLDDDGVSVTESMQVAWMRDPDGNILTLFQLV